MYGDATNWDENAYRETVLKEREIQTRTVFRTAWAPPYNLDTLLVASSDGSVASYSISSSIAASKLKNVSIISIALFFVILFNSSAYRTILLGFNYRLLALLAISLHFTTKLTVLVSLFLRLLQPFGFVNADTDRYVCVHNVCLINYLFIGLRVNRVSCALLLV